MRRHGTGFLARSCRIYAAILTFDSDALPRITDRAFEGWRALETASAEPAEILSLSRAGPPGSQDVSATRASVGAPMVPCQARDWRRG